MYLTFQDYSKLNEWINKYITEDKRVQDARGKVTTTGCKVVVTVVDDNNGYTLYAGLYIGEFNPFDMYNYIKFKEDMHLIIGQVIMESRL